MSDNTPSEKAIIAAAKELDTWGRFHKWWPDTTPTYENLDSIGKSEFEDIVWNVLKAGYNAENTNWPISEDKWG